MPLAVLLGATVPHAGEQEIPPWVRVQVTPLFAGSFRTVGAYCCVALTGMRAELGETETLIARTVMVAEPDFDVSATEVAVMVTCKLLSGGLAGALYVTELLVTLLRVPAPDVGDMVQVTPLLLGSKLTVAVKDSVPPACTRAALGVRETVIAGTLTVAEPDFDGSATEVAVMVTVTSLAGGLAGALYVTEVLVTLLRVPAPDAGEMVQVTPLFAGSF